jgi:large subunit ribosomal protein L30
MAEQQIEITQVRSLIGSQQGQRRTVRALGLRKIRHTVTQPDRPEIRGMIAKVAHLVEVRYPGEDEPVGVEPGQEPKGAGRPPAGPSVADDEVVELREAEEEALAESGSASLGEVTQRTPRTSTSPADRPKPPGGPAEDEAPGGPQPEQWDDSGALADEEEPS